MITTYEMVTGMDIKTCTLSYVLPCISLLGFEQTFPYYCEQIKSGKKIHKSRLFVKIQAFCKETRLIYIYYGHMGMRNPKLSAALEVLAS